MDTVSASSSYSQSLSLFPTPFRFNGEFGTERMVKIELEAAEALAALAGSTDSETCGAESVSHRIDNESAPIIFDLDQRDQETRIHRHYVKTCDFMSENVKMEQYGDVKRNPRCMTTNNGSSSSCKSRQNLTEAEKESRKLRRVLANRESARQTIRRRQAFYEELTRKAADLALENENLKRVGIFIPEKCKYSILNPFKFCILFWDRINFSVGFIFKVYGYLRHLKHSGVTYAKKKKEIAIKEYDSSKSRNELLKARMSELVKSDEIREAEEEAKLNSVDVHNSSSASTTTCPVFIYSQPFNSPFIWPSIVQPSNSVQSPAQLGPTGNPDSYYVLPFPFLLPLPSNNSGSDTLPLNLYYKQQQQQQDSLTIQHFSTSTSTREGNCGPVLSLQVQDKISNSTAELENRHQQEMSCGVKTRLPMGGDPSGLPEKCPVFWRRRKVNVVATAEARRKRKEVTRLKNLHLRLST